MRSLMLVGADVCSLPSLSEPAPGLSKPQTRLAVNAEDDALFAASASSLPDGGLMIEVSVFAFDQHEYRKSPSRVFGLHETPVPTPPEAVEHLVSFKALPEASQLCLVTAGGELGIIDIPVNSQEISRPPTQVEVVGAFDEGIKAAEWSPDEELLALVTGSDKMVVMTKTFDPLVEEPLHPSTFGENAPVALGWGQKATQFHGSLGKSAAQAPQPPSTSPESVLIPSDDLLPRISWRGDGAFFSVSSPSLTPPRRRTIRVYSRAGVLTSTSEAVDHQGPSLAWRPEGSIIASTRTTSAEAANEVIFFERNGLRRYDFGLRDGTGSTVRQLSWNADSSILAVWTERAVSTSSSSGEPHHVVGLWTRNNYHWYLKQELRPQLSADAELTSVLWHPEKPLQLYLASPNSVEVRTLSWQTFGDPKPFPDDTGSVAVVDGSTLLLTAFRYRNVPPPMASTRLLLESKGIPSARAPVHVAFSSTSAHVAILFDDGAINVYQWVLGGISSTPEPALYASIPAPTIRCAARQVAIRRAARPTDDNMIQVDVLFTSLGSDVLEDLIMSYTVAPSSYSEVAVARTSGHPLLGLTTSNESTFIQSSEGVVWRLSEEEGHPTLVSHSALPGFCSTWTMAAGHPIGMSEAGQLFAGRKTLATDCSSFAIDPTYLIWTTFSHQAKFLPLASLASPNEDYDAAEAVNLPSGKPKPTDLSVSRRLERGSRIVTVVPSTMSLILQMPRGNLETLCPRPLVIEVVLRDLDARRYRSAFLACRKHRIDLNLLFDYNPSAFLGDIGEFVSQLQSVDYLNLFLAAMRPVDVCQGMYKSIIVEAPQPGPSEADSKINRVCDAVLSELRRRDVFVFANSILTAHMTRRPPDYASALGLIAELNGPPMIPFLREIKLKLRAEREPDRAEDAVKYIIFLSDVKELYGAALGIYDLGVAVLIAQHSQMDPKEYLPFLRSLRDLDADMQKFKIDDNLRRHAKAVRHLKRSASARFEDVLSYTKQHALYEDALLVCSPPNEIKTLRETQGDYLASMGRQMEAGLAYTLAEAFDQAIEAYRDADAWQEALAIAVEIDYQYIPSLVEDLLERLVENARHLDAARLLLDHGQNLPASIAHFCKGFAFAEAIRVATIHGRSPLVVDVVIPAAQEHAQEVLEEIAGLSDQVTKQRDRLLELKTARDLDPDAFYLAKAGAGDAAALEGIDAMKDATTALRTDYTRYTVGATARTTSTGFSRSSSRTAKSRRKEERKKATGKKGSVYEEEYLMKSISQLCTSKLPELQGQLGSFLPVLVRLSGRQRHSQRANRPDHSANRVDDPADEEDLLVLARTLQASLSQLSTTLSDIVSTVWSVREAEIIELEKTLLEGGSSAADIFAQLGRGAALGPGKLAVERPKVEDNGLWKLGILDGK